MIITTNSIVINISIYILIIIVITIFIIIIRAVENTQRQIQMYIYKRAILSFHWQLMHSTPHLHGVSTQFSYL